MRGGPHPQRGGLVPPLVAISGLQNGSRVRAGTTISAAVTVTDPDAGSASAKRGPTKRAAVAPSGAIARVEYYLNASKVKDAAQPPYGFDFNPPSAGTYVLTAIATDGAGLSTVSAPVRVEAFVAPTVSIVVKGSASAAEGGAKAKFLVSRDGSDLSQDLTVSFKAKGTAKNGTDYSGIGTSIVIPTGAASVKLKIKPTDNALKDGTRTVTIKLLASPTGDYDIGSAKKATVSILDND